MGRYTENRMLNSIEKWRLIRKAKEAGKYFTVKGRCGFCYEYDNDINCDVCPLFKMKVCSNSYTHCLFWEIEDLEMLSDIKKMERIIIDVAEKVLSGNYESHEPRLERCGSGHDKSMKEV